MGWRSFWTLAQGRDAAGFPKYGFESYVTVVATAMGATHVTMTPTADIRAGVGPDGTIERVPAGTTVQYTLQRETEPTTTARFVTVLVDHRHAGAGRGAEVLSRYASATTVMAQIKTHPCP